MSQHPPEPDQIDLGAETDAVRQALLSFRQGSITGSQVHTLLRQAAPDLDFRNVVGVPSGPGALSKFIAEHLHDTLEVEGNHGGDILYSIVGHPGQKIERDQRANLWKAFVSPSSPFVIIYNKNAKALSTKPENYEPNAQEILIEKASVDEHDLIRSEFQDSLSEDEQSVIKRGVGSSEDFSAWINTLKAELPSKYRSWGAFRREKLLETFLKRADSLLEDAEHQTHLKSQIKAAHFAAYDAPKHRPPVIKSQERTDRHNQSPLAKSAQAPTLDARQLAHLAIDSMGWDELQSMKVSVGALLEALRKRGIS